jgi:hypothetical protein
MKRQYGNIHTQTLKVVMSVSIQVLDSLRVWVAVRQMCQPRMRTSVMKSATWFDIQHVRSPRAKKTLVQIVAVLMCLPLHITHSSFMVQGTNPGLAGTGAVQQSYNVEGSLTEPCFVCPNYLCLSFPSPFSSKLLTRNNISVLKYFAAVDACHHHPQWVNLIKMHILKCTVFMGFFVGRLYYLNNRSCFRILWLAL